MSRRGGESDRGARLRMTQLRLPAADEQLLALALPASAQNWSELNTTVWGVGGSPAIQGRNLPSPSQRYHHVFVPLPGSQTGELLLFGGREANVSGGQFFSDTWRWNGFFWAMVLLQDEDKIPLQVYLRKVIVELSDDEEFATSLLTAAYSVETVTAAIIVCSIIPILMIYPFLQKYFSKGILLGGVKE